MTNGVFVIVAVRDFETLNFVSEFDHCKGKPQF